MPAYVTIEVAFFCGGMFLYSAKVVKLNHIDKCFDLLFYFLFKNYWILIRTARFLPTV